MGELATSKQESQEPAHAKAVYEAPALVTGFDADYSRWAIAMNVSLGVLEPGVLAPPASQPQGSIGKAANDYHLKAGQREVAGTFMFYRVILCRGKFNL